MGVFRSVAAAHCHDQANDLTPQFEAGGTHRCDDYMRKQRIACDNNVCARNGSAQDEMPKLKEKIVQQLTVALIENRETR